MISFMGLGTESKVQYWDLRIPGDCVLGKFPNLLLIMYFCKTFADGSGQEFWLAGKETGDRLINDDFP